MARVRARASDVAGYVPSFMRARLPPLGGVKRRHHVLRPPLLDTQAQPARLVIEIIGLDLGGLGPRPARTHMQQNVPCIYDMGDNLGREQVVCSQ